MKASSYDKKQQVEWMFDSIAPTYDLLNHLLSIGIDRGWRRKVVAMVTALYGNFVAGHRSDPARDEKDEPVFRILDVATGTGDLAIAMARKMRTAHITGVDISEKMLAEGRRKVAQKDLEGRLVLQSGDAERLGFPEDYFGCVTAAFGVRNFGDMETGLREMCRVLSPGGSCIILEFSEPRGSFFGTVYRFYFHRVLPLAGRFVSRNRGAYSYLPRSVADFPSPERFGEMLLRAGFSSVRTRKLTFGVARIYECGKLKMES